MLKAKKLKITFQTSKKSLRYSKKISVLSEKIKHMMNRKVKFSLPKYFM